LSTYRSWPPIKASLWRSVKLTVKLGFSAKMAQFQAELFADIMAVLLLK